MTVSEPQNVPDSHSQADPDPSPFSVRVGGRRAGETARYRRLRVLGDIDAERDRQISVHGDQSHLPMGTGVRGCWTGIPSTGAGGLAWFGTLREWAQARTDRASQSIGAGRVTFEHILTEEFCEVLAEGKPDALRRELIQLGAVCVQMVETLDQRAGR